MIQAIELSKKYGEVQALDGLSFDVPAATVFGLLGPNGAGKSTAVRILTTLSSADDAVQVELASAPNGATSVLAGLDGIREVAVDGRVLRARADDGARAVPAVLQTLEAHGVAVTSVTVARPSLDDVYLRHAGRSFHEADTETTKETR